MSKKTIEDKEKIASRIAIPLVNRKTFSKFMPCLLK